MKLEEIKVCILRIEGTNCEQEAYDAFKVLGAEGSRQGTTFAPAPSSRPA
jgi:phosphoribosylformylglycinamidine (FGAM) synthase-like amidotransferase family enzyme